VGCILCIGEYKLGCIARRSYEAVQACPIAEPARLAAAMVIALVRIVTFFSYKTVVRLRCFGS
jgi:hypothetical protein